MAAVGILGWRSVLNGSKEYDIPDLSDEAQRSLWENDDLSPFPTAESKNQITYTSVPVPDEYLDTDSSAPVPQGKTDSEIEAESASFGESNVVKK